jgi:hypothetical protein
MDIFPQSVSACFSVAGLGMDVTIENLPFDWTPPSDRDESGANAAALWLWRNAPECRGKAMSLVWVSVSPRRDAQGAAA